MHTPSLLWPEGKRVALSFSWDDGRIFDRRVVDIHNAHGVKGTFHLNSGSLESPGGPGRFVRRDEIAFLFRGHEISCHSVSHPFPSRIPVSAWLEEMRADKITLEDLSGAPVRSASWPFGDFTPDTVEALRLLGIRTCRSTRSTQSLRLPDPAEWLTWSATCAFSTQTETLWRSLLQKPDRTGWFSVWSHSYEMEDRSEWGALDAFCASAAGTEGIWHATVSETHDYLEAWRALDWSVDQRMALNVSSRDLWVKANGHVHRLAPGLTRIA
jgi:hypothetical protein